MKEKENGEMNGRGEKEKKVREKQLVGERSKKENPIIKIYGHPPTLRRVEQVPPRMVRYLVVRVSWWWSFMSAAMRPDHATAAPKADGHCLGACDRERHDQAAVCVLG